jgi:hypothetical protein
MNALGLNEPDDPSQLGRPRGRRVHVDRRPECCGLCGHAMILARCGSAGVYGPDGDYVPLCHADDHSCYHRWTVYRDRPAEPESESE